MSERDGPNYGEILWQGATGSELPMPPGAWWCDPCRGPVTKGRCPKCGRTKEEAVARLEKRLGDAATVRDRGDWFQTFTGKQFFFRDIDPDTICLEDIAHALSLLCRFNGHVRRFYSVAQHSVLVARCLSEQFGETNAKWQRTALFHDAAECYIGDMVKPLKCEDVHFQTVEAEIEEAIAKRFDLLWPFPPLIKRADIALLLAERNALMGEPPVPWRADEVSEEAWAGDIEDWGPFKSETMFLQQAREYLCPK
jgi:hypothetical protein